MHWLRICLVAGALTLARPAPAEAPPIVGHQGVLTLSNGAVVADGLYTLTFQVCDAAQAGNCVAGQQLTVDVTDGLYNVLLSDPSLVADMKSGNYPFLNVRIDSGADPAITAPIDLAPRQQLASVPYALVASETDGDLVVGTDPVCPGQAGTLRYAVAPPGLEVCDGTQWVPLGFRRLDVEVFNASAPISWSTLPLAAHIGPGAAAVFLRVVSSADPYIAFRPGGQSLSWIYLGSLWPFGSAMTTGGMGNASMIVVTTDDNGDVEWRAGSAFTVEVRLLGFVR